MYRAEMHGKVPSQLSEREDLLTSNVFSFLKYANRRVFLRDYLAQLDILVSAIDAEQASFMFWPSFHKVEPDLVIVVGDFYVMFEAKYRSGLETTQAPDDVQLSREIRRGLAEARKLRKSFRMVYITADYVYPAYTLRSLPAAMKAHLRWTNWQRVDLSIRSSVGTNTMATHEAEFARDLCDLLDQKGLRSFQGVRSHIQGRLTCLDLVFYRRGTTARHGLFGGFRDIVPAGVRLMPRSLKRLVLVGGPGFEQIAEGGLLPVPSGPVFFIKEGI